MPTANPRVNVTLKPHQYELLSRLGRAQGRSRAAILLELLETVFPVLERVVVAIEGAERAQVLAREGFRESINRAEAAILPHVQAAMGQLDLLVEEAVRNGEGTPDPRMGAPRAEESAAGAPPPGRPPRGRKDPRPVTRGSGRGGTRAKRAPSGGAAGHRRRAHR